MNLKLLGELINFRDLRNALLGLFVIVGGLGLAGLTLWAHRSGDTRLAGIAATVSLAFVLVILVFVVPPLVRNASAEASQMDLPFEFTVGGAIYLGLLIIVGFAAWNTGNNLLFLVLSVLISAIVVGFFVGNFCLKKLDVKMRFPETIYAESATPIMVSLNNRKRIFPTYSVTIEVRGREREKSPLYDEISKILPAYFAAKIARPPIIKHTLEYFLHVPRRRAVENRAEHVFEHRGRFIIKDFELSTRFPFGFFRHRRRLSAQEAEVLIFPKVEPVQADVLDLPLQTGKLVSARRGGGQDLLALRDYQPQDDLRHVDWKATARARRIIVREFAAEDDKRVTIVLDTRLRPSAKDKTKTLRRRIEEEQKGKRTSPVSRRFEKGVSQTASLLTHFDEEQTEIRLVIDDQIGEFGIGKAHLYQCLKRLVPVEPDFAEDGKREFPAETVEKIFDERDAGYTFFVTSTKEDYLPEEIVQTAQILKF